LAKNGWILKMAGYYLDENDLLPVPCGTYLLNLFTFKLV
jgi:hypothetical protein